jgi:DNA ligase-associated metallophosphoesterase
MTGAFDLVLAGERMVPLGTRALYWPARERLLIADLHLGKADTFRHAGIALPRGGTAHDLDRLTAALAATGARELWVLGDLLHGAITGGHWREAWDVWRARHAAVEIAVLAGNHDRALRGADLDVRALGARIDDGPFAMRHAPEAHPTLHVLCGHLHPVVALPGMRRRWPAFWLRPGITVLPAFSEFTGGWRVDQAPGERRLACVDDAVIALPGG